MCEKVEDMPETTTGELTPEQVIAHAREHTRQAWEADDDE